MNAMRLTHWPNPNTPTTVATLESDMKYPAVEVIEQMLEAGMGFFTYEIFEVDTDEIVAATIDAAKRADAAYNDERNQAIAYLHYAQTIQMVKPDGLLASTLPAPLNREQMAWVLRSLAKHPNYEGQRVSVPLWDGSTIEMKEGEVLPV